MLDRAFTDANAWRGAELAPGAGHFTVAASVTDELTNATAELAANPLPLAALRPDQIYMPATQALMAEVKKTLTKGIGFALIDRLPLGSTGEDGARMLFWLMGSMIERPVAQNWGGDMIYDVTDTGRQPGNGTRPDKTSAEQNFHTDNSYNLCTPNFVGLLCLRGAKAGGTSHIVSLKAAHNALRDTNPKLLKRLYSPFYFDRQREHAPNDAMTFSHPLFVENDGELLARLSKFQVINGQQLAGKPLDAARAKALDALEEVMSAPGMDVSFQFEPGQIQFLNNRVIGHRRTRFTDWPKGNRKRLLVRIWIRDQGGPFYNG